MDILLSTAIKAAIEAGAEIMKIYNKNFDVELKSDFSPLTVAYKNANTIIENFLKKTNLPIISEESKQVEYAERKNWETCWIVDPLDGTKEFIKRNGEFTVNIALIKKNKPILGVIYVPDNKTLYYGNITTNKAYKIVLKEHNSSDIIIPNSNDEIIPIKTMIDHLKVIGSRTHKSVETDELITNLRKKGKKIEVVSKGSSMKFCLVVEGKANIYPRFAPTMEWDTAAGHAICNAVGLKVMQVPNNGEELKYNKENLLNPYFIVNQKLMDHNNKQEYSINRQNRKKANKHHSFLIWFTGLSGSGKSTIANLLEKRLFEQQINTYTLDGDNLRRGLNKDLIFSKEDRNENLRRTAEVAKLFVDAGIVVIAAFISPYIKTREEIKYIIGSEDYIEVFVNTPLEICE
ncbi:3'(2'),5'-bisphosphate nucleotidase [Lutibacter flavus]|uniref:3'(2'),5'-bisphosphate nucleotidase CysQ n=1 Tax=Lutibacter flavus TaxID=691689 RepID=A0A238YWA2_9FLAO|nr:3'(2'),5'-bisphosphate nucleotidase [Lutibacter flavus]